jgi:hypothetical protein
MKERRASASAQPLGETVNWSEKMRLISFQTPKGQTVMVNPNQVRCVVSLSTGSKIEFARDHSILVTTGAEAAKSMLAEEEGH